MPDPETTVTTEAQAPKAQPSASSATTMPDTEPVAESVEQLREKAEAVAKELEAAKAERATLEKRLKDNQEYISRTRNVERAEALTPQPQPQKTLDDYLNEVTQKFEDDPKEGLKKVIRDMAFDRDLERQNYERAIAEAEERAVRKVMALNPESQKMMQAVEALDQERPDLENLTFEQKSEFIALRSGKNNQVGNEIRNRTMRETELAAPISDGRAARPSRIPAWGNDPEVLEKAVGHFTSKQEMIDWSDPQKARAKYQEMRASVK